MAPPWVESSTPWPSRVAFVLSSRRPTLLSRHPTEGSSEGHQRAGCTLQPHSCVGHPLRPGGDTWGRTLAPLLASPRRTSRPSPTTAAGTSTPRSRCRSDARRSARAPIVMSCLPRAAVATAEVAAGHHGHPPARHDGRPRVGDAAAAATCTFGPRGVGSGHRPVAVTCRDGRSRVGEATAAPRRSGPGGAGSILGEHCQKTRRRRHWGRACVGEISRSPESTAMRSPHTGKSGVPSEIRPGVRRICPQGRRIRPRMCRVEPRADRRPELQNVKGRHRTRGRGRRGLVAAVPAAERASAGLLERRRVGGTGEEGARGGGGG
jgi:hypothetical protein